MANDVKLLTDESAKPDLQRVAYSWQRVSSPSDMENTQKAEQVLTGHCEEVVTGWNSAPGPTDFKFAYAKLTGIEGQWSKTKKDKWGKRTWNGGGIAVGELYYSIV